MTDVEDVTIESDERGFELHIAVGDDIEVDDRGRAILNVQAVAEKLLSEVVTKIGPWLLEGYRIRREMSRTPFDEEDAMPLAGESAFDFYQRTGEVAPLLDMADYLNKRTRESP